MFFFAVMLAVILALVWIVGWFLLGFFVGFVKWVFFDGPYATFKRSAEVVEPEEIGNTND